MDPNQSKYLDHLIVDLLPDPQHSNHDSMESDPFLFIEQCKGELNDRNKRKSETNPNVLTKESAPEDLGDFKEDQRKKIKTEQTSLQQELRIPRKTSDDLIKVFEQLPEDQIKGLLDRLKQMNTPDLRLRLDVSKILPNDLGNFSLNDGDLSSLDEDQQKKNSVKKRKEKECKCCNQLVKRHQCKHTSCEKPCPIQERIQKTKPKTQQ